MNLIESQWWHTRIVNLDRGACSIAKSAPGISNLVSFKSGLLLIVLGSMWCVCDAVCEGVCRLTCLV